ncbi:MAG: thioredoxin-disulfide reductase [Bacteroidales bacterium]|nr:thioredoxin-disulfide reductase [Bacteroidales bacterium]
MELFKKMENTDAEPVKKNEPQGEAEKITCLILGSGPAGFTAAIYAARANLKPVMYQGMQIGGQLTTTTEVENYPGYPEGVSGPVMMEDFQKQAERFGTDVRWGMATAVDFSKRPFKVVIDEKKVIEAQSVIIATGATAKYLGLESEKKYMGFGVSACATCDGFFYRGQDVAVVGGGDTALEEALYLSGLCRKVYLIHRRDELRGSKIMQERVMKKENIEVVWNSVTKEIVGEQSVNGVILENVKTGETQKLDIQGFFVAIGHKPNSEIFTDYLEHDEIGYLKTKPDTSRTNVEGVFACGDVMDSVYRQAVTAAGTGCRAAIDAERWLSEKGIVG